MHTFRQNKGSSPAIALLGLLCAMGCQKKPSVKTLESQLLAERDFSEILVHTPNPEQSFLNPHAWDTEAETVSPSLALYIMELGSYCNAPNIRIPVGDLEDAIRLYRSAGKRMILRPVYSTRRGEPNQCGKGHYFEPASLDIYQSHLEQIGPVLEANKDVVVYWQLGVLGPWGEWHGSGRKIIDGQSIAFHDDGDLLQDGKPAWGDTPPAARDKRLSVLKLTLESIPKEIYVQVRRPVFRYEATRRYDGTARWFMRHTYDQAGNLTKKKERITNRLLRRVGFFNDCFLASTDDWGTYNTTFGASYYSDLDTVEKSKAYVASVSLSVPMGGETCPAIDGNRLTCEDAEQEMSELHWVYLNADWWKPAIDGWREQGCFDRIQRSLGKRYVIDDVEADPFVAPGKKITVKLRLRNVGYAIDHRQRRARLVLEHQGGFLEAGEDLKIVRSKNAKVSRWLPGETTVVSQTIRAPKEPGMYYLHLRIQENETRRPEHAIRIASYHHGSDVWNGRRGENDLGMSVEVTGRCIPKNCEDLGFECGLLHDGCGQTLQCGTCSENQRCRREKPKSPKVCVDKKSPQEHRFSNPSKELERWEASPGETPPQP